MQKLERQRKSYKINTSEDEKRLEMAREAASGKRRQKDQLADDLGKKPTVAMGADNQLFCGKNQCPHFIFLWFWIRLRILPFSLSDLFVLREFKDKIRYARLSEAN